MYNLSSLLQLFGEISEYKVSASKSAIMGWNMTTEIKTQVSQYSQAPWVKYLGIKLVDSLGPTLRDLNFTPVVNSDEEQLTQWQRLKLSWSPH